MVKSILVILLRKANPPMLKELSGIIAEFVCAPPYAAAGESREERDKNLKVFNQLKGALAQKAKGKKKKAKKQSDEEDWNE